ncbi:unnamed protein product [Prunus armeniaca]|uniref:4-alpha-glucanotransferase n=1 Tax=Prunus armeniaca TaxID=36596 RepID=A0A6J5VAH0_PRUAR|nr:unnamed protein product [Prunus armeniaca]
MVELGLLSGTKSTKPVHVSFRIPYYTHWGQSLLVCGSEPVLGSWNLKKGLLLSPVHHGDELIWFGTVPVPKGFKCEYSYYVVDDNRNVLRWEMGEKRKVLLPEGIQDGEVVELHDLWQVGSDALPLKSAFKDVIFHRKLSLDIETPLGVIRSTLDQEDSVLVHFKISCPNIEEETSIYIIGNTLKLGQWNVQNGLKLSYSGESIWHADCVLPKAIVRPYLAPFLNECSTYKYCKYGKRGIFSPETGPNRDIVLDSSNTQPRYIFLSDGMLREIPWRGAGVAIPMFSVRSEADLGVGEFLDLKLFVDWAAESGFHLVQLLPINDTSVHGMWWDSYPYSSLSVFALHPLYLRVQALSENIPEDIKKAKEQLDGKNVDYEASLSTKLSIAKKIFAQEKDLILNSSSFQKFFSENQLSEAADYARKKGVILKGDLPIGVDRNSVDTWVYPNLFRMNTSTGAPPDYFDKNGQNWGFPTYNWEEMSKDNYAWWRTRLTQMAKYFTAYRIDHILGFFRIWELPEHAMTGLVGKFRPSIPLSQEELEKEGIWDFDRLTHPYILQKFLQDKFGSSWTFIASNFLNEYQKNRYEFKEDCNTEKKIASKLKSFPERSLLQDEDKIRRELFDLVQNIVLIRDPENPRNFYPRFNLEDTPSFKDLDDHRKSLAAKCIETLPALLNSSDMLACGEDLGLIPSCVHPVMQELGLIGLRIQRMPSEPDLEFGIPSQYSYMTVCAPSCHDCSTLRAWWEEDEERRQRYFKNVVGSDTSPPARCVPDIAHFIIREHVESPSMWAIFPLQDLLALKEEYTTRPATEETINDPTNPKHYWRYRVHVTVEALIKDKELVTIIKDLVSGSGRSHPGGQAERQASHKSAVATTEKQQIASSKDKVHLATPLNSVAQETLAVR